MELFGYQITKKIGSREEKLDKDLKSFVPKRDDEGSSSVVTTGGYYGQYVDIDGTSNNSENELIVKYREAASQPECDQAINDIVDGAIASGDDSAPAALNMNDSELPDSIKKQIQDEFSKVLSLYKFNRKAADLFKEWYIDGRLYFHVVTDEKNFNKGIKELRQINPLYLKKVKEVKKVLDQKTGVKIPKVIAEYYIYSESGDGESAGVKIANEAIISCPSGLLDINQEKVISHLHKSMKLVNQLRMMEDSLVMYRVSRAPERRIFYIDVGNLPKVKAEQYLKDVMNRYRNKLVYDASTGEIRDDRNHMSMLEDFWLPRREGGRGTEITTLPGGSNLGEIDDIKYFQNKLYRSLNVPVSRMEAENNFSLGRSTEITRDELKFTKFVQRIRKKFTPVFTDMLKTQLVLKGVISLEEWDRIKEHIQYDFLQDGHFAELKKAELLNDKVQTLQSIEPYIGQFFSKKWVQKNVLQFTDSEIDEMANQLEDESEDDNQDGEL